MGLFDLARFELRLFSRLKQLQRHLRNDQWFNNLDIGRLVTMPKPAEPQADGSSEIVRIGRGSPGPPTTLSLRLQLEPSPEFAIAEVLYLREFGPGLEALLTKACLGYRLKGSSSGRAFELRSRDVYEYWPKAFRRYRTEPMRAAHAALKRGKRILILSTDISAFFDSVDPQFLLERTFMADLEHAAEAAGHPISRRRYIRATRSLLDRFSDFRALRSSFADNIDTACGVPIGALTSRPIANVALASIDRHFERLPSIISYRRYVDDIVIVAHQRKPLSRSATTASTVARFLPPRADGLEPHQFTVPATRAIFSLNLNKTRIHELTGPAGIDLLESVRRSFSAVASERRAFLGNLEHLESEIETVNLLIPDEGAPTRIPQLRDADRFTLRQFITTPFVRGLERCALLLDRREAIDFLSRHTQRVLSALDNTLQIEDFDLVLAIFKVSLLCDCKSVSKRLQAWLDDMIGATLARRVANFEWRRTKLRRSTTITALRSYLQRRIDEATAGALMPTGTSPRGRRSDHANARLLRASGLRHLDHEDDASISSVRTPLPQQAAREHVAIRAILLADRATRHQFRHLRQFINASRALGEDIWHEKADVGLFLAVRPPRYLDVAKRYLAPAESEAIPRDIGAAIDTTVDAMRGTNYRRRRLPAITLSNLRRRSHVDIGSDREATTTRVVLASLPVGLNYFDAAARGKPIATMDRLRKLDGCLRLAQRAKDEAPRDTPLILVLPELAIPRRWERALAEYAVREDINLVAGLEYIGSPRGLVNQAVGVFPAGRYSAAIVKWTKRHPSQGEKSRLTTLKKLFGKPPSKLRRLVVGMGASRLSVLICSEILETTALASLTQRIELLVVPAWNDDTTTFDHTAQSASLLVHAFVAIANNAEASDARIVAPIKEPRYEREWCRLIHRDETQIVWGDLPVGELREAHETRRLAFPHPRVKQRVYRPLPPQWRSQPGSMP